jgi:hypothetical protein
VRVGVRVRVAHNISAYAAMLTFGVTGGSEGACGTQHFAIGKVGIRAFPAK